MSETPHPWDRLPAETLKAHEAFLAYVNLGARRSVREAARQHHSQLHIKRRYQERRGYDGQDMAWLVLEARLGEPCERSRRLDSRHVRRAGPHQHPGLQAGAVTRAHAFLSSTDSEVFLRGARAFTLQHPPVQQVEDVTRIEDLSDVPDAELDRMREIRDAARKAKDDA